jgi:hypothetical protein
MRRWSCLVLVAVCLLLGCESERRIGPHSGSPQGDQSAAPPVVAFGDGLYSLSADGARWLAPADYVCVRGRLAWLARGGTIYPIEISADGVEVAGAGLNLQGRARVFDVDPETSTIVYSTTVSIDEPGPLYIRSGDEEERLPVRGCEPSLSPGGRLVAYTVPSDRRYHSHDTDPYHGVWIFDRRTRKAQHLGPGVAPRWSPDGAFLLAVDGNPTVGHGLIVYHVNTKKWTRFTMPPGTSGFEASEWEGMPSFVAATFSSDGRQVAFLAEGLPAQSDQADSGLFITDFTDGRLGKPRLLVSDEKLTELSYPLRLWW